ncbi:olfactory receptor 1-like [Erpetoichthys calabaricus]|uniref:olfactory receptor 1-like n=1 Tax=Erpetoichthys calabaricus TaxID=27687 RepID=UPI002234966B|nr:olfactory receptor 1-like [Erpetoichthys calabaricus]
MTNNTVTVTEFVLHCAIDTQQDKKMVYIFIFIYIVTIFGNLSVILVIKMNRNLQTPMYLYISTLAVIDLMNSTTLIPKLVAVMLDFPATLFGLCVLQMFLMGYLEVSVTFLFALMACDRYVAIVYPLRYPSIVTNQAAGITVLLLSFISTIVLLPYLFLVAELSFCRSNVLPYCFCDYVTMVRVSCNDDPKYLITLSTMVTLGSVGPLALIIFSYVKIAQTALKISSNDGKRKVYSTCVTHLMVVCLFYFPLLISYVLPGVGVKLSTESTNMLVIIAHIIPSMMNPIIYSFRNNEIKNSIYKMFRDVLSNG